MTSALTRFFIILALAGGASCSSSTPPATGSTPADAPAADQTSAHAQAATAGSPPNAFTGAIVETMNAGGYTYARLKSDDKEVWVAAPEFEAEMGELIAVSLDMPMENFESKTLKRQFPLLYFVAEVARNGAQLAGRSAAPAPAMASGHGVNLSGPPAERIEPPAGGLSVADVFAQKADLSGKRVTVRGKVVKFNGGIMDRNWLHVQDGSGRADAGNDDLAVTTDAAVTVGDIVTVSGVLGVNKDFGAGYAYDAILEQATISR